MTTFELFCARCKLRHDFDDMIQVRYQHANGESYDAWVSGEEALGRLRSEAAEERLKGLSRLDWEQVRESGRQLPAEGKQKLRRGLKDRLAGRVEEAIGGNVVGDSLAEAIRGRDRDEASRAAEKARWQALLQEEAFREKVLELAWIQLEGSFPDEPGGEPDDWV
ncbi:MAG: hypothetical protein L0332_07345 [Chloroflexi bacterium]|nr:hypothetical protein [Chloroflexota bacterium]MCI0579150.1 hypothetical protein [Chloroflexota bacterium]MCI0643660.1 hypothetical protein [Chloroflexota bacterium]MCI0726524.1 hypothetical protein [Chloroflexota bacterium]